MTTSDQQSVPALGLLLWRPCNHTHPARVSSVGWCFGLSLSFVLSLYFLLPSDVRTLPRSSVRQIKWRLAAVTVFSFLATASYPFCLPLSEGESSEAVLMTKLQYLGWSWSTSRDLPLLFHATSLFLGPIVARIIQIHVDAPRLEEWTGSAQIKRLYSQLGELLVPQWFKVRDYFAAPLVEEIVFRGCMAPPLLAAGFSPGKVSFLAPLFFGTAHVHHAILKLQSGEHTVTGVVISTLFQFTYTSLFGTYATYAFVRTGSVCAVALCHMFCNMMGFPDFRFLDNKDGTELYGYRHVILLAYAVGVYTFASGFFGDRVFDSMNKYATLFARS